MRFKVAILATTGAIIIASIMAMNVAEVNTEAIPETSTHEVTAENFTVVELFTSQGCHSCPPADRLLSSLVTEAAENGKTIYPLSFHVDYWNYLGWKDPYSDSEFSDRQRRYANRLNSSVYTPQMVFNGESEAVGSRPEKVQRHLKKSLKKMNNSDIQIQATSKGNKIEVTYSVSDAPRNTVLNIALVERNISDQIKRGENRGKELHHDNVVRVFKTERATKSEREVSIKVPTDVDLSQSSIIAFLQNANTLEISGAKQIKF